MSVGAISPLKVGVQNISASASAVLSSALSSTEFKITADSYYVRAEIEGHVDFFLFEVSGSVTFELRRQPDDPREVGLPHYFALTELVGELLQPPGIERRRAHGGSRVLA